MSKKLQPRRRSHFVKFVCAFLMFLLVASPLAQTASAQEQPTPEPSPTVDEKPIDKEISADPPAAQSSTPANPAIPSGLSQSSKRIVPKVDETTGALTYQYPLQVPSGRNGLTPDVALTYNSEEGNNQCIVGYGWTISIPHIRRVNKHGSNELYTANYPDFVSSLSGEIIQLTQSNPEVNPDEGTYAAKVENGEFLTYTYFSSTWMVKDKKGTIYTFGNASTSRQDNPTDNTKIYKWMLQEIRDANDNYVKYAYYKEAGQIYPSKITYTGNGATDGIFEIDFLRETRADSMTSHESGFPVITGYRINVIRTKVSSNVERSYALSYTTGDNGIRSILFTITETGIDTSTSVVLPPTELTSIKNIGDNSVGWTNSTSTWNAPPYAAVDGASLWGDINGDAYTDVLVSYEAPNGIFIKNAYLNNGDGTWTTSTAYLPPVVFIRAAFPTASYGYSLQDINGDGLADIFRAERVCPGGGCDDVTAVYINTGNGWNLNSSYTIPTSLFWQGGRIGLLSDLNGDGLVDIYRSTFNFNGIPATGGIYLNNGDGTWKTISLADWVFPYPSNDLNAYYPDLNGDGITDIVFISYNYQTGVTSTAAYLGNGRGQYISTSSFAPTLNLSFFLPISPSDYGVRFTDINGDGLPDLVYAVLRDGTVRNGAYLNTGTGWSSNISSWAPGVAFTDSSIPGAFLLDINADGLTDIVRYVSSTDMTVYLNNAKKADLVSNIKIPEGGTTAVTYTLSSKYISGGSFLNPNLPLIMPTVSQTVQNDVNGVGESTSYTYSGGSLYFDSVVPRDRKFVGYNKITKTDNVGNKVISYFHQGNTSDSTNGEYNDHISKAGKVYRTEATDNSGNMYAKTINKWDSFGLVNEQKFVKLAQTVTQNFDGNASHKDKAVSYVYEDLYGNEIEETQWGEVLANNDGTFVDVGNDKRVIGTSYASNAAAYIVGLPSQETITNQAGERVAETRIYYDDLTQGAVIKGNPTKEERWKEGGDYVAFSRRQYDNYGLVIQERDGRGNASNYGYDSFNLYPATITNALSQSIHLTYDYSSGQIKRRTDENGRVFEIVYDGFDRVLEEKQPDINSPSTLVTKTQYIYTDQPNATSVKQIEFLAGNTAVDSYVYFDGFGRNLQERKRSEGNNQYAVRDFRYNSRGLMEKESLPYFSNGATRTTATTNNALYTSYLYDALDRVQGITNSVGTTTNAYDDWKITVMDALGKSKTLYKDPFDRLVQVDERIGAETYVTRYDYNSIDSLLRITDALGNVRNFSYDGLGRRKTAEDLHAPSDSTFGVWQFTFDDASNLTRRIDPKGQTVDFEYDALNRAKKEDFLGQSGVEVNYIYDTCPDGIGRLCNDPTNTVLRSREYNALGLVKKETNWISNVPYLTQSDYDFQGNVRLLTNPDGSQVKYEFNHAGFLESVLTKEQSQASFTTIAANFDYTPTESIAEIVYPSGTKTVNTYDANELYRLKRKLTTTGNGANVIQDFNYTFDAVGNIRRIHDSSNLNSRKILNYFYDDLHRLTNAYATKTGGLRTYRQSFNYDALGNFTNKSDQGAYQYNGNQGMSYANPHAVTAIGASSLSYDRNGNLESVDNQIFYTWDYNNRLRQANKNGLLVVYDYTSDGERVSYNSDVSQTISPTKFFSFSTTNGIEKHVFAGNMMLATIKGTGQQAVIYYDHTDHLSGANIVTKENGKIVERLEYYPFGSILFDTSPSQERRKFAGHEYDLETGLSYMIARYYDGAKGRFLSIDPVFLLATTNLSDPQALNAYSYARNNPLRLIDPDGKAWRDNPLLSNVAGYGLGLGEGFVGGIAGAINSVLHPVETVKSIANTYKEGAKAGYALQRDLRQNFSQTNSEILGGLSLAYNEFESKSAFEQGRTVGNVFGQIEANIVSGRVEKSVISSVAKVKNTNGLVNAAGKTGLVGRTGIVTKTTAKQILKVPVKAVKIINKSNSVDRAKNVKDITSIISDSLFGKKSEKQQTKRKQ